MKSIIFRNTKNVLFVLLSISFVIFCCACGELDETNMFASNDPTQGSTLAQSTGPTLATDPTQNTQPTQNNNPTQNGNGTPSDDNSDYIIGGSGTSSDVTPPYSVSCVILKEFGVDNDVISIQLSFGLFSSCSVATERYREIVVYAENSEKQIFEIRQFDSMEIEYPEYMVKRLRDENLICYAVDYAHTESVDLPISLFTGNSGWVWIGLHECSDHGSEQHILGEGAGIFLCYTRNETSIVISKVINVV